MIACPGCGALVPDIERDGEVGTVPHRPRFRRCLLPRRCFGFRCFRDTGLAGCEETAADEEGKGSEVHDFVGSFRAGVVWSSYQVACHIREPASIARHAPTASRKRRLDPGNSVAIPGICRRATQARAGSYESASAASS